MNARSRWKLIKKIRKVLAIVHRTTDRYRRIVFLNYVAKLRLSLY